MDAVTAAIAIASGDREDDRRPTGQGVTASYGGRDDA
jgi:hypothetical protein